jgi:hypothetical protein
VDVGAAFGVFEPAFCIGVLVGFGVPPAFCPPGLTFAFASFCCFENLVVRGEANAFALDVVVVGVERGGVGVGRTAIESAITV